MAIPSEDHIAAFGALIHHYALVESGLKIALSGLLNTDLGDVLIISQPYNSINLRNVVKAIAKNRIWKDPKDLDCLIQIVGDFKPIGPLRNHIAHSRWMNGTRPNSIKPRHIDIRNEKAEYYGERETERDWLASEIKAEAAKLAQINLRLWKWLEDTGLKVIIERNMAAASASNSA